MSLAPIIALVVLLAVTGTLVDRVLSERAKSHLERWAEDSWLHLDEIEFRKVLRATSAAFVRLFDVVYGTETFSLKRIIRSIFSTCFAIAAITLLAGPENTIFAEVVDSSDLFNLLIIAFCLNIIVDFFSLVETRVVLGWSFREKIPIALLAMIDLCFTVLIFLVGWFLLYAVHPESRVSMINLSEFFIYSFGQFLENGFDIDAGGVFFYSTFFTSATWYLFIFFGFTLRALFAMSSITKPVLIALTNTNKPGQLFSAFAGVLILTVYALARLVEYVFFSASTSG